MTPTPSLASSSTSENANPVNVQQLTQAAELLHNSQLVAFPTETVYGLAANAESPEALARLYAVKGRPSSHPVIVHIADASQLSEWTVDIPEVACQLAEAFWPGPLTLILKRSSRVPDAVTGGQDTVGIRVPSHPVALALLKAFGGGVAAPSANRFGRLSPTTAQHVREDLGDDVQMILDGGACEVGVESTIVAFRDGKPVILRPGMITEARIQAVIGSNSSSKSQATFETTVSRAPGTLASHYAPCTPVTLVEASDLEDAIQSHHAGEKLGVLSFHQPAQDGDELVWRQMPTDPATYAQQIYARLRELDGLGLVSILVERVPNTDEWAAVSDRLSRAAHRA